MHFLTPTILVALFGTASMGMPTSPVPRSAEALAVFTPEASSTEDVVIDGITKRLTFYGESSPNLSKRQFYINPDQNQHYDRCGPSNFTALTSQYSPAVSDCRCIVDGVTKRGGYWFARPVDGLKVMTQIISCGSCAFAIKSDNEFGSQIGDVDIRDVFEDSIRQHAKNGLVGASGTMGCQNDQNEAKTTWTIMHVPN